RERREDIATLAFHFLGKYSKKIGRRIDRIDDAVMQRLQNYHWPGNVRELENIIERAVILTEGRKLQLDEAFEINAPPLPVSQKTLGEVEQEMIQSALELCDWKIEGNKGAATRLALAPSTLRERIRKYGLERHPPQTSRSAEKI
ncbi:MAG: sigma-54-dependent Fis family transcriptional regulator, partial [Gammaproteobacteria bacterium]|nr:sigma-54-dependent Fis family transcriptional regulator [Gammaproteobacteria bacterium]